MIIDSNVSSYIKSFEPDLPDYLTELGEYGRRNEVPIIKKDAESLLRFAICTFKPENILEIGTAIGYSASYMLHFAPDAKLTTLELSEDRIKDAKNTFKKNGLEDRVTLIEGDASETLSSLAEAGNEFDFVFMDAAKAQYSIYFEYIKKMLVSGGVLLTDNILQEGSVCESKFSVTRRDRTIHKRMRDFIRELMQDESFNSCIIPIGDGMLLSTRK